jgi:exosortase family protein XrtF
LLYLLLLFPSRILDKPLTDITALNTARTLNFLTHSSNYTIQDKIDEYDADGVHETQPVAAIYYQGGRILSVADACNALELFVLYAGFIICFPSSVKRKITFIIGGIILIYFVNVLRCTGLTWIFIYYPKYGDFSHHYLFTFIVYACIFLLWIWFSKKTGTNAKA